MQEVNSSMNVDGVSSEKSTGELVVVKNVEEESKHSQEDMDEDESSKSP